MESFLGYQRPDGSVGIRNHVLVLPGGLISDKICSFVRGTRTIVTADQVAGRTKRDRETLGRLLRGLGRNPNVAAVVYLARATGSSYPESAWETIAQEIAASGKPVEVIDPVKEGGSLEAMTKGIKVARELVYQASRLPRTPCPASALSLGVKCGASDPTSGAAGNPVIGYVYDKLVSLGGTALFGETTEIIGAEHSLAGRAVDAGTAQAILDAAAFVEGRALQSGEDIRGINPVPENIAGGISSLEEKSLGAIHKSGSAPIRGALKYGERPPGPGLYFVDNWASHLSIFVGYAAAGSQLVLFQLGGGGWLDNTLIEPFIGGVVAPLMWTTANASTWSWMGKQTVDFYSGTVIEGKETVEECGERLFAEILATASGGMTRTETVNYNDAFQAYLLDPMF